MGKFKLNAYSVIGVALVMGGLLTFQNCSKAKFSPTAEAGLDYASKVGAERTITLEPKYTQASSLNPIKVLLVVDNSDTMSGSQANLARNLKNLLDSIKSYDASIMVVSTSIYSTLVTTNSVPPSAANTTTELQETKFNSAIPRFTLLKSMSDATRNSTLANISNYVTSLGTGGDPNEAQLATIGLVLDKDTKFFAKGDTALIYVITDEDDTNSVNRLLTIKRSEIVYTNGSVNYVQVPGYIISYYSHVVTVQKKVLDPGESGTGGSFYYEDTAWLHFQTHEECVAKAATYVEPYRASCYSHYAENLRGPLNQQDPVQFCDRQREFHGALLTRCDAPISYTDSQPVNGQLVSRTVSYFLDTLEGQINPLNEAARKKFQHKLIKAKMDELFGSKYLVSVQTNVLGGQTCQPVNGQTWDKTFEEFGKLFPSSNFYRTSICDPKAINGDALKDISIKFNDILQTKYMVALAENEEIVSVSLYRGSEKIQLKSGTDYSITGNSFQILKTELETFDRIEVKIVAF